MILDLLRDWMKNRRIGTEAKALLGCQFEQLGRCPAMYRGSDALVREMGADLERGKLIDG